MAEPLTLRNGQSPGDILMLTAAVRDLARAHPGRFDVRVSTPCPALWENNPHAVHVDDPGPDAIEVGYAEAIQSSNQAPRHFVRGFAMELESKLGLRIPTTEFRGDIHLSDDERGWINQVEQEFGFKGPFWIVVAGGKFDFTAKWWDPDRYQEVVDRLRGRIQFVQVGSDEHFHPRLDGVLDLVGRTDLRQLVRLIHHSAGVLCGVTFAMHAAAAVPVPHGRPPRACVVVAGGREPVQWEAYPGHRFLSTQGSLPCCAEGGCWKSRATLVGDGDRKDREDLCEAPVEIHPRVPFDRSRIRGPMRIGRCMDMISARDVVAAIESYYQGGFRRYGRH